MAAGSPHGLGQPCGLLLGLVHLRPGQGRAVQLVQLSPALGQASNGRLPLLNQTLGAFHALAQRKLPRGLGQLAANVEHCQVTLGGIQLALGCAALTQCGGVGLLHAPPANVPLRLALHALRLKAAMVHPGRVAVALQVCVLDVGPALAGGLQALGRACAVLPAAAPLGGLGVVPLEIQLRVAVDAVHRALAVHDVGVWLLASLDGCGWAVDRPLAGVAVAQLLGDEVLNQLAPLAGGQFARKCHLNFPIRRAVRPLELISRRPEVGGVVLGPGGHVGAPGGLQVLVLLIAAVFALAGNVLRVGGGLAFAADFDRAMIRGHALPCIVKLPTGQRGGGAAPGEAPGRAHVSPAGRNN